MPKTKGDWTFYVSLFKEASKNPKKMRAIFSPHVGKTFERPDKKLSEKIVAVEDDKVYIDRFVVLEKPMDFITFRFQGEQIYGVEL